MVRGRQHSRRHDSWQADPMRPSRHLTHERVGPEWHLSVCPGSLMGRRWPGLRSPLTTIASSPRQRTVRAHFILLVLLVFATPPSGATTLDDIDFFVDNMVQGGTRDQFPAMTNPTPVRPDEVSYVADHELVLGVYLDGEARAYPQNLGWVHEIINDELVFRRSNTLT